MELALYQRHAEVEETHWWFVARRTIIRSVLSRLHLPSSSDILEIGCGTGGNISMLSAFGRVMVMDNSPEAEKIVRERFNVPMVLGSFPEDENRLPKQGFDLVALFDVLEHLKEDREALEKIKPFLKPTGKLILTVPAYQWLWGEHDKLNQHYRRYSKNQLERVLKTSGYTIEKISYFNSILFPIIASVRVGRHLFPKQNVDEDLIVPSPFFNRSLAALFSSEQHFLKYLNLPFGTSILAIAS